MNRLNKEIHKKKENQEDKVIEEEKKFSDKALFITIGIIILILASIFTLKVFMKPKVLTIDELHTLNLKGKLKPEQGYVYNGYSFVKVDNFWYTQIKSAKGTRLYSLMFRFGPKEVLDVEIKGKLNTTLFDSADEYYVTFNPLGSGFSYVAAAVNDFNQNMLKAFNKQPIAACDKNETEACKTRPIITCENTDKIVFYVNESETTAVKFNNNCIVVDGYGTELIRAVDRLLFLFYGVV